MENRRLRRLVDFGPTKRLASKQLRPFVRAALLGAFPSAEPSKAEVSLEVMVLKNEAGWRV